MFGAFWVCTCVHVHVHVPMVVVLLRRCVKRKSTSEGQGGGGVVPCMFCIGIAVKILATVNARQHIAFLSWVGGHGMMMH